MALESPNEITPAGPQLSLPIATRVSMISREQLAHDLRLSIAGVSDGREASWYGPWALALQIMFMDFRARNVTCYTAAQMPVVRGYDPAVHDEIGQTVGNEQDLDTDPFLVVLDPEAGAESTIIDMSAWSTMEVPNTPEGPIWTERDAYPDDRMAIMLTDTAPASPITPEQILRPPQPPNTQRTPSLTLSNKPSSIPKNIRSTRVPDFSQILKFFNIELTRLLCTRLLVIIEIKPPNKAGVDAGIRKATDQVIDQARHAFEADKTLEIIGCIIGVGRGWTYFDVRRNNIPIEAPPGGRITRSRKRRPGQLLPPNANFLEWSQVEIPAPFLKPYFGEEVHLELQDGLGRSDLAFERIYQELVGRIWRIHTVEGFPMTV